MLCPDEESSPLQVEEIFETGLSVIPPISDFPKENDGAVGDELTVLKDRWYYSIVRGLDRLEAQITRSDKADELFLGLNSVEKMPDWAVVLTNKSLSPYFNHLGFGRFKCIADIDAEVVGNWLGSKVLILGNGFRISNWLEKSGSTKRAEFFEKLGQKGAEDSWNDWAVLSKKFWPPLKNIRKKAFRLAEKQSYQQEGLFFSGYGAGLKIGDTLRWQLKHLNDEQNRSELKRAVLQTYISLYWPLVEVQRTDGGWPAILEGVRDFFAEVSDEVEVDEDAVKKTLQRAGMTEVGKVGRPVSINRDTD